MGSIGVPSASPLTASGTQLFARPCPNPWQFDSEWLPLFAFVLLDIDCNACSCPSLLPGVMVLIYAELQEKDAK